MAADICPRCGAQIAFEKVRNQLYDRYEDRQVSGLTTVPARDSSPWSFLAWLGLSAALAYGFYRTHPHYFHGLWQWSIAGVGSLGLAYMIVFWVLRFKTEYKASYVRCLSCRWRSPLNRH